MTVKEINIFSDDFMEDGSFIGFNEETIAALREIEQLRKDPSLGKTYNNIDELLPEKEL